MRFDTLLKQGVSTGQAWQRSMVGCTVAAKEQAKQCLLNKGNLSDLTNSMKSMTLATKAASVGLKVLSVAGNMILFTAIAKAISVIGDMINSAQKMRDAAKELGNTLKESSKDIDDYKTKIEDLYKVINDSSSSINDVTQARSDLMTVQDELIEKFGAEKGVIESVTNAINGQSDALDELANKKYLEVKNEFNTKSIPDKILDWVDTISNKVNNLALGLGFTSDEPTTKMDRMIQEMLFSSYNLTSSGNEELDKLIEKIYADVFSNGELRGSLEEIQSTIQGIQELSSGFITSNKFEDNLANISSDVSKKLASYQSLYDQYILNEKILINTQNNQYDDFYKSINDVKENYDEAVLSGDENRIKQASENYAKTLSDAVQFALEHNDNDVADFFEDMYPELQQMVSQWDFEVDFTTNKDNLKDSIDDALDSFGFMSTEEVLSFNPYSSQQMFPNSYQDKNNAYATLNKIAEKYNLTYEQLIKILEEEGKLTSERKQTLERIFGKFNINKLSDEDLEYAYSIENPESYSWEKFNNEIEKRKKTTPKNTISFTEAWKDLDTTDDNSLKQAKKDILELAESGTLTAESLKEVEGAEDYFAKIGLSAEQAAEKINATVEETKQLTSLQKGISSIQTAFKEKKDDKSVSAETFSSMSDTFGDLKSWDNYKKVLGSTTSTTKECEKAQNKLATEWVNSNNFLSQLNKGNKDYYVSLLKNMGITNASAVVEERLSAKRQTNKLKTEALAAAEKDFGKTTANNTTAFLKQANATNAAKVALADLVAKQKIFNTEELDVTSMVSELNKLALAYFGVSNAIQISSAMGSDSRYWNSQEEYIKAIRKRWNKLVKKQSKTIYTSDIKIDPTKSDDKDNKNKKSKESFDWIEKRIEFIQSKLDTLKSKFENLFTYDEKKNNLNKQLERTEELLKANEKAADKYYKKAEKVKLSGSLKKKVREGDYDITKYGEKTANRINKYADYIGKATDAENNTITLKTDKNEIKNDIFQLDIQEYERAIELIENKAEDINNEIERIETAGSRVGASYYNSLKANNEDTKKIYKDELAFLEEHLKTVKKGSDEWYETNSTIQEVKQSIAECNKEALEFNDTINEIRRTSWENANSQLERVIAEHDFIAGLAENEKSFDSDTGLMTDAGLLKLGVSAVDKKIYDAAAAEDKKYLDELLAQREEYERTGNLGTWNSIESLNTEIDTVYSAWQENIEAVGQKNKEIAEMMTEQYNSMLDVVNELIDAKQEELSAEKDLRDYQRQVSEQTDEISTIEKQIAAYRGNTSQEAQAKLQQLELQRQEAVKALQETEEDRAFSDMSDMLTKMGEEYSELIAKKIDDFKSLVSDGMDIANKNIAGISETMNKFVNENGYTSQYTTNLNELPSQIATLINDSYKTENTTTAQPNTNTSSGNSGESNTASGKTTLLDTALKYVENHLSKAKQDKKDLSDVNKKFYAQYNGKVLSVDEMKKLSEKLDIEYDNASKTGKLYKKLKKIKFPGFSRGGVVVDDIDKVLKANGDDTIGTLKIGERVLTPVQNEGFEKLVNSALVTNPKFIQDIGNMSNLPELVKNNSSQITQHNDIALSLTLPNVVDTKSLIKEVQTNKTLQDALQTVVVNPMLGKSTQDAKHIH